MKTYTCDDIDLAELRAWAGLAEECATEARRAVRVLHVADEDQATALTRCVMAAEMIPVALARLFPREEVRDDA